MKRTRLWRRAVVIIIGLLLLAGTACGKKGDPVPPQAVLPAPGATAVQPEKPAGPTPGK